MSNLHANSFPKAKISQAKAEELQFLSCHQQVFSKIPVYKKKKREENDYEKT